MRRPKTERKPSRISTFHVVATLGCLLLVLLAFLAAGNGPASAADTTPEGSWSDLTQAQLDPYEVTLSEIASISDGYPDGLWRPQQPVTRAQFTKMAVTAFGIPLPDAATTPFTDVAPEDSFCQYIEAARNAGLVSGVTPQSFAPDRVITRQQTAAIIARYVAQVAGVDLPSQYDDAAISSVLQGFPDGETVAAQLRPEYVFALETGIIDPLTDGSLQPQATLDRLQCAALIIRGSESVGQLSVAAIIAAPANSTRVQESDARFDYNGYWRTVNGFRHSGGTARYTSNPGDQVKISFQGTRLVWVAQTGPSFGRADVSVDGRTTRVVDLYSGVTRYQQRVFDTGSLPPGSHTVIMKLRSDRSLYSRVTAMNMDAVEIVAPTSAGGETTTTTSAPRTTNTTTSVGAPSPSTTLAAPTPQPRSGRQRPRSLDHRYHQGPDHDHTTGGSHPFRHPERQRLRRQS